MDEFVILKYIDKFLFLSGGDLVISDIPTIFDPTGVSNLLDSRVTVLGDMTNWNGVDIVSIWLVEEHGRSIRNYFSIGEPIE